MRMQKLIVMTACALLGSSAALAQFGRGAGDFVTTGSDAHRSSWIRTDPKISKDRVSKLGEFQFLWKVKLNNPPAQGNSLSPLVVLDRYIGYRGFRSLGYVGGSSDSIFAFDTDLGKIEWQKRVSTAPPARGGTATCPGGMTANVSRTGSTAFPGTGGPTGGGRGGPARSGVGEPNEGAVTLANVRPPQNFNPPSPRPAGAGSPRRNLNLLYAISSDGLFHAMYVSNGDEPEPAMPFLPAGANAQGLIVVDDVAYAATSNGCGNAADGVWALDLVSKKVSSWKSGSAIAGSAGPAFSPDGTIYVATTKGDLVALEAKSLSVTSTYSAGQPLVSSPLLFQFGDKVHIAVASRDGNLHIVSPDAMQSVAKFQVASGGDFAPGALSSWQDSKGMRWFAVPSGRTVAVVKMDKPDSFEKVWTSAEMIAPKTPLLVNGVLFALSAGSAKSPAVMYALDPETGKEFWNSGKTLTSHVSTGVLSAGGTQVYVGTHDGTLYAFGFPMEH